MVNPVHPGHSPVSSQATRKTAAREVTRSGAYPETRTNQRNFLTMPAGGSPQAKLFYFIHSKDVNIFEIKLFIYVLDSIFIAIIYNLCRF
jgi:hypothetical protein